MEVIWVANNSCFTVDFCYNCTSHKKQVFLWRGPLFIVPTFEESERIFVFGVFFLTFKTYFYLKLKLHNIRCFKNHGVLENANKPWNASCCLFYMQHWPGITYRQKKAKSYNDWLAQKLSCTCFWLSLLLPIQHGSHKVWLTKTLLS